MPSGSHGGSPGSHFSGGSHHSSSGSSFGRSISRSFSSGPRPIVHHRIVFFGRPYIYTSGGKKSSILGLFVFMLVLGFIILLGGIFVNVSSNQYIHKMEQDYEYYQEMIEYASLNPAFKKPAKVTDRFQTDYQDKYYFTYSIACATCSGGSLEGYTYTVYTKEEIRSYQVGTVVEVATNSAIVDSSTDSIPMDYKNKTLEDDGEYVANKKSVKGSIAAIVIASVMLISSIAGAMLVFKKSLKREEAKVDNTSSSVQDEANYCPYCNQMLEKGQTKCPNCGAGVRR